MKIKPEHVTALADSREQQRLNLSPLAVETTTLQTGDYTALFKEAIEELAE